MTTAYSFLQRIWQWSWKKTQREILDSRKTGYVQNSGDKRNMQGARKTEIRKTDKEAESTEGREETGYQS